MALSAAKEPAQPADHSGSTLSTMTSRVVASAQKSTLSRSAMVLAEASSSASTWNTTSLTTTVAVTLYLMTSLVYGGDGPLDSRLAGEGRELLAASQEKGHDRSPTTRRD